MLQSLSGQVSAYLADSINFVSASGRRLLRSASGRHAVVPRTYDSIEVTLVCVSDTGLCECNILSSFLPTNTLSDYWKYIFGS